MQIDMIKKIDINANKRKYFIKQISLFFLLVIIFMSLHPIFLSDRYIDKMEIEACYKINNMDFNGIVDSINNGPYVKMRYFFIKKNDEKLSMWIHSTSFLEKGDSIVKKKGVSQYVIYKKESFYKDSIVLTFNCNQ